MEYEAIIGLEVHAQLLTKSKMFCGCDAAYQDAPPNTHVCPVCLGLPGSLPVINKRAVEQTILTGLAFNCEIPEFTKWDRKNYHYPDLPKAYQISQYDLPLTRNGFITVEIEGQTRRIGIRRIHLEEDTGRLYHMGGKALVDYNRSGIPLMEIVTEPDIRSPEEARLFLQKLRTMLRYLGVSSGDMEAGALRVDANVSVRPKGSDRFGTQVEVKNMNSFRSVKMALEYEIKRQIARLERGEAVVRETRGWVESENRTVSQRSKEEAHDYRYFPEPDLPPLIVNRAWVEQLRAELPEMPDQKAARFVSVYGLSEYAAGLLVADRATAEWFEEAVRLGTTVTAAIPAQTIANWMTSELFRRLGERDLTFEQMPLTQQHLIELLVMIAKNEINNTVAKKVLVEVLESGQSPTAIVEAKGLKQVSDTDALLGVVRQVLDEHPEEVAAYLGGREQVAKWLMGQVMRATRGKANPKIVLDLLTKELEARRATE